MQSVYDIDKNRKREKDMQHALVNLLDMRLTIEAPVPIKSLLNCSISCGGQAQCFSITRKTMIWVVAHGHWVVAHRGPLVHNVPSIPFYSIT